MYVSVSLCSVEMCLCYVLVADVSVCLCCVNVGGRCRSINAISHAGRAQYRVHNYAPEKYKQTYDKLCSTALSTSQLELSGDSETLFMLQQIMPCDATLTVLQR